MALENRGEGAAGERTIVRSAELASTAAVAVAVGDLAGERVAAAADAVGGAAAAAVAAVVVAGRMAMATKSAGQLMQLN